MKAVDFGGLVMGDWNIYAVRVVCSLFALSFVFRRWCGEGLVFLDLWSRVRHFNYAHYNVELIVLVAGNFPPNVTASRMTVGEIIIEVSLEI